MNKAMIAAAFSLLGCSAETAKPASPPAECLDALAGQWTLTDSPTVEEIPSDASHTQVGRCAEIGTKFHGGESSVLVRGVSWSETSPETGKVDTFALTGEKQGNMCSFVGQYLQSRDGVTIGVERHILLDLTGSGLVFLTALRVTAAGTDCNFYGLTKLRR